MKKFALWLTSLAVFLAVPAVAGVVKGVIDSHFYNLQVSNQATLANGSATTPALSWTVDPDTGWFHIGSGNDGWAQNGTKKLDVGGATYMMDVTGTLRTNATTVVGDTSATNYIDGTVETSAASTVIGTDARARSTVSSGQTNSGAAAGVRSQAFLLGAGTIAEVYGVTCSANTGAGATGTITTAYGLNVGVANAGSGTGASIGTGYGVYIGGVAGSTAYGIYQTGATNSNFFAGQVTVGTGKTIAITDGGSTSISTGDGAIKMTSANPGVNTAWIPIKYGGNTYYVPAWTAHNP